MSSVEVVRNDNVDDGDSVPNNVDDGDSVPNNVDDGDSVPGVVDVDIPVEMAIVNGAPTTGRSA